MSPAERAAALAHDVGKYITRIAKNVPEAQSVPAALRALLAKDLYEAPAGEGSPPERPSARFDRLSEGLTSAHLEALAPARSALAAIDALEPSVRAGDPNACDAARAHALEVERQLRAFAAERSGEGA